MPGMHSEGNGEAVEAVGLRESGTEGGAQSEQDDVPNPVRMKAVERQMRHELLAEAYRQVNSRVGIYLSPSQVRAQARKLFDRKLADSRA
jgi:hypothetical protein